jgi:3-hydroxyisobutyrate dehydrogenase-like beta-hydroxyacid dehydrogenase
MSIRQGTIHINITTISPNAATELNRLHEQHAAHYISAPVRLSMLSICSTIY